MCVTIQGRDGHWRTVNLNYLFVPAAFLLLAAVAFVANVLYRREYKQAFDKAYNAALNGTSCFSVNNNLTSRTAVIACAFSTPEIFTVSRVYTQEAGDRLYIEFEYNETARNYIANLAEFKARVSAIADSAPVLKTDEEKARWIHDYLVDNYSYGGGNSALSILRDGQGVCQAYTGLFTALAKELGLDCGAVVSELMGHTWNTVKIDGDWYHIDVTWDDSGPDRYKYYMKTDAEMLMLDHYGWYDTGPALALITKRSSTLTAAAIALSALSVLLVLYPLARAYYGKGKPNESDVDEEPHMVGPPVRIE